MLWALREHPTTTDLSLRSSCVSESIALAYHICPPIKSKEAPTRCWAGAKLHSRTILEVCLILGKILQKGKQLPFHSVCKTTACNTAHFLVLQPGLNSVSAVTVTAYSSGH